VASIDPHPFASWQEGLFVLSDALSDPTREKIIVARLEADQQRSEGDLDNADPPEKGSSDTDRLRIQLGCTRKSPV
jgi:hypothetical protein